ncbi:GNAT family N-acetyltransferase [Brevibacillus fluminis]|uniref:GNAT family N-acetyltransferase n=1 Tax=Brevibacillus fluminis TaxID=511487 RepID=A0A3M8DHF9_9BACL|nr:GNAT family N-acetyltransferase [Brevibacillus fluminis]RNB87039.1 GNAT family N-acetyltransferase [Brevibacillus fluminis]
MIVFKRLNACTLDEAVLAYNRGYEGYFFDQTKTVDSLAHKIGKEELSPSHSIVAFYDGEPVGIVLNGIWQRDGKKVAWNGGTGVAPAFRGKGVGRALMDETLAIYREAGVEQAALVAVKENETAIALYEKVGYRVVGQSIFLESQSSLLPFHEESAMDYPVEQAGVQDVYGLAFWPKPIWDIQWQSIENRVALVVRDENGQAIGYALYRRLYDEQGQPATTLLFHCAADPTRHDTEAIIRCALSHAFDPLDASLHRLTVNYPAADEQVLAILREAGFGRMAEQVFMVREMSNS